jgi:hypothetical protein
MQTTMMINGETIKVTVAEQNAADTFMMANFAELSQLSRIADTCIGGPRENETQAARIQHALIYKVFLQGYRVASRQKGKQ